MTLFISPGSCSFASHILLHETGLKHSVEKVDLRAKTWSGGDYTKVNPKGYVPALQLDSGEILTENVAVLQYLADRKPGTVSPAKDSMANYHFVEWLAFISTEIHKGFAPLWNPASAPAEKEAAIQKLGKRFDYVSNHLKTNEFLIENKFTAADAYLFTVTRWSHFHKIDLSPWPALKAYMERIEKRPSIQAALSMEAQKSH